MLSLKITRIKGLPVLSRSLNACTPEHARVAVLGFEPQVPFIAEARIRRRNVFYDLDWLSSNRDQALTIERWSRQACRRCSRWRLSSIRSREITHAFAPSST